MKRQNGHGNAVGNGLEQLDHNQPQTSVALFKAEAPLHFSALTFVYIILHFVAELLLLRRAQGWAGQVDAVLFAVMQILPIAVALVRQKTAGKMPFTFLKNALSWPADGRPRCRHQRRGTPAASNRSQR